MIVKNFKSLSTSAMRKCALEIINAGIEAALVVPAMTKQIKISNNMMNIQKHKWDLSGYEKIYVVGAGKASGDMALAMQKILGKRITKGIVIDTKTRNLKKIKVIKGTHPLPSQANVKATHDIINLIKQASKNDLIINLISGGGSALLCAPRINLDKQIEISKMLLARGATIQEINTIRKHISYVKGGQLALYSGAEMITLIVSDVLTNDLNVIASGPTVKDPTTKSDAERISTKYKLPELDFIETPKKNSKSITNILLITNISSVEAMKAKAKSLGYKTKVLSTQLKGEAREIGLKLAKSIKPQTALIAAGETTVHVHGNGKGGRNQELALAASEYIKHGVVISCASDGVDFITRAAGGIVDENTKLNAEKKKLNTNKYLKSNDSYNFLKQVNGIIITGKTGTNVADLMLALG